MIKVRYSLHKTRRHIPLFLVGIFLAFAAIAKPHAGHAETGSPQKEALDLLTAKAINRASLVVTVEMENGMYSMRYDLQDGKSVCPRGGDLIVPVGMATDINVTSSDKIIRWTVPQVGFDVTAIPGRIESERLNLTKAGHYQVKPPPGNQDKVSDIPMHVMTLTEFQNWFKKAKVCP
jgi:heme/copper-type cytochrome/quinol oxidase subunit 2